MVVVRVLAIIGNALMLLSIIYMSLTVDMYPERFFIYLLISLPPILSIIYLYQTRFYTASESYELKIREKKSGLIGLWLHRKKLEEQAKIEKLKP